MDKKLLLEASEALAEEDYENASKLYCKILESEPSNEYCLSILAHIFLKLNKYQDVIEICTKALKISPNNSKIYLKKGIAHFHLKEYSRAHEEFNKGIALEANSEKLQMWKEKCLKMLPKEIKNPTTNTIPSTKSHDLSKLSEDPKKTKYDWYQTETHVIVTILLKNVKEEKFKYNFTEKSLSCNVDLGNGSSYSLELDLQHCIIPEQCSVKIFSTKIELKLKKEEGIRWTALEDNLTANQPTKNSSDGSKKYPSSSPYTKDWDKLASELKDDKEEGDAALNQLFQQIYSDGSDETKKAMMKSFTESGGTVLSTNWKEIGEKKTEIKPPDGMEYKKWQY